VIEFREAMLDILLSHVATVFVSTKPLVVVPQSLAQGRSHASRHGRPSSEEELSAGTIQPSRDASGRQEGVIAVAASILTSAYFILRDNVIYRDLGADYLDQRDPGNSLGVSPNGLRHSGSQSTSVRRRSGWLIGEGFTHPRSRL
jgi:hypothetical protein